MLVSGHQDVVLQSEVSGPGPRHVEHVLLPLQALPADPVLQDLPGARLSTGRNKLRFKNNCEGAIFAVQKIMNSSIMSVVNTKHCW